MLNPVYSLRDEVAQTYFPPFIDQNDDSARRSFGDAISSGKFPHARDYSLYRLGTYDSKSGVLTPETVSLVSRGSDFEVNNNGN